MARLPSLYQWTERLATALPHLTGPQVNVLALWSFGMVCAKACSLTAVASHLAEVTGRSFEAVRGRLREWYLEAGAKSGHGRLELDVAGCFAPLLRWVLRDWPTGRVALALDATGLGDRFAVLVLSVVYRGGAVPVAWRVLPGNRKKAWKGEWLRLLRLVRGAIPEGWRVLVLADRGLYARWLYRAIRANGWHPLVRVQARSNFRPDGARRRGPMTALVPEPGDTWRGSGWAFKGDAELRCTLLAYGGRAGQQPWFVLTDLPAEQAEASWYGLRTWIERGFKALKSGGWGWPKTRMTDPARAERLWLALAVATWWALVSGTAAEAADAPPEVAVPPPAAARGVRRRSVFQRGLSHLLGCLLRGGELPWVAPAPEPWPEGFDAAKVPRPATVGENLPL